MDGERLSVWHSALVGLHQLKRRAGQSLPVARERKFQRGLRRCFPGRDEFRMGGEIGQPLCNKSRYRIEASTLSIRSLPMVQLWQNAPKAESHNTTAAKALILIAERSAKQI